MILLAGCQRYQPGSAVRTPQELAATTPTKQNRPSEDVPSAGLEAPTTPTRRVRDSTADAKVSWFLLPFQI